MRDFEPAYDRCGSVAPDGYAKCGRGMSAPRRKRTSRHSVRSTSGRSRRKLRMI